jgi:replicative DNA helicase
MKQITDVSNYFDKYSIEFITEQVPINTIYSKFTKFCKEHKGGNNILIIDNLAYVKMHLKDTLQFEDDVARTLVDLRDRTNGTIILLHHLTKETDNKWNKDTGYEPKIAHIRGSKRLVDCPNQVILLHRPDFFSDLVDDAIRMGREDVIRGLFLAMLEINRDGNPGIIKYRHSIQFSYFEEA